MKVLIACEESQTVCKAFRALGHEAYSCDLLDCSGGHPEWHIKEDAAVVLNSQQWDLVIAHPPCTRLANSGVRWLAERKLWFELIGAMKFFNVFNDYGKRGNKIVIENPIPHKYAVTGDLPITATEGIGKYNQIIHPWQFGHNESKATCLWLHNVPELKPTDIVEGREQKVWRMPPGENRSKERSKTYEGIAKALANQYGII